MFSATRSLVLVLALFAGTAHAKGCGAEVDVGGLCDMALGSEQCQQISQAISFLPAAVRPPTAAEAQAAMDKKCDELRKAGQLYLIKKMIMSVIKAPYRAVKAIFSK